MSDTYINILLVEDDIDDAFLIQEALEESNAAKFKINHAKRFSTALKYCCKGNNDIILLDLFLPDSQGFDTFIKIHEQYPDIPIVILTGLDDETMAFEAVKKGAQDYLIKQRVKPEVIVRVILYAIERHKVRDIFLNMALVDELTGIYNRRGLFTLAEHQLRIANRKERRLLLIFIDLDGMKQINDNVGHNEGDLVLIETGKILTSVFRSSDIVARIGGDEFAVLALETAENTLDVIRTRIQEKVELYNTKNNLSYKLSLSMGIVEYNPENPCSIDKLMAQADKLMYEEKRSKKNN